MIAPPKVRGAIGLPMVCLMNVGGGFGAAADGAPVSVGAVAITGALDVGATCALVCSGGASGAPVECVSPIGSGALQAARAASAAVATTRAARRPG